MSSRPFIKPHQVFEDAVMGVGTIYSDVTIITNLSMASYDISWSGTGLAGEFLVQVSNTYQQNSAGVVTVTGNWTTLTLSADTLVAADSGNGFINLEKLSAYAMRLAYVGSAGSGVLNAYVNAKVT
jgi:hypothetical protein